MHSPDDELAVDPAHVHEVGTQIRTDATNLIGNEPDGVQDFQNILTQINDNNFPVQLYSTFYQFITTHVNAFTQIFQDRQKIGDTLHETADAAELNEVRIMSSFNPTPLTATDGPYPLSAQ